MKAVKTGFFGKTTLLRGRHKSPDAQAPKREKERYAVNKAELVEETADQPGLIRKTSTEGILDRYRLSKYRQRNSSSVEPVRIQERK